MKVTEGDFLIVEEQKLLRLVKVEGEKANKWKLRDKQSIFLEDYDQQIDDGVEKLVANLGTNPKPGKAYGVGCEPILKHVELPIIGDIYFFRRFGKEERKGLLKAYQAAAKRYMDLDIFPFKPFISFIMPAKKSSFKAGTYHWFKSESRHDEITLFAEDYTDKQKALYVMLHELAHGVWFTRLDDDMRADWIEAYHEVLETQKFGNNRLTSIREGIKGAGSVAAYKRMAEEDEKEVLSEIMRYIARVHSLSVHNINAMLATGRSIKKVWPSDPVELSKKSVIVSDYANTCPEEFFAEALSYWIIDQATVPKRLRKLIKTTIARAKVMVNPFEDGLKAKKEKGESDE